MAARMMLVSCGGMSIYMAGTLYTLRFDLAGSARGSDESVSVRLGGADATYGVAASQP